MCNVFAGTYDKVPHQRCPVQSTHLIMTKCFMYKCGLDAPSFFSPSTQLPEKVVCVCVWGGGGRRRLECGLCVDTGGCL